MIGSVIDLYNLFHMKDKILFKPPKQVGDQTTWSVSDYILLLLALENKQDHPHPSSSCSHYEDKWRLSAELH